MPPTRDYSRLIARLDALRSGPVSLDTLGEVNGYPVLSARFPGPRPGCRRILLASGIHGDEPAGPEALIRFIERGPGQLLESMELVVLPCMNPHGYVYNTRENADGVDLNRAFDNDAAAEVALIKRLLGSQRFHLFIDLHEDWEYPGYYLYELVRDRRPMGPSVIEAVKEVCPIHPGPIVDEMPVINGIVQTNGVRTEIAALTIHMYLHHCDQALTLESPSSLDFEQRVQGHLLGLEAALSRDAGLAGKGRRPRWP